MVSRSTAGAFSTAIERKATIIPSSCSASIGGRSLRSMANPPAEAKASGVDNKLVRFTMRMSTARGCSSTMAGWRLRTFRTASSAFLSGVMVAPEVRQGKSGRGRAKDWTSSESPIKATVSTVSYGMSCWASLVRPTFERSSLETANPVRSIWSPSCGIKQTASEGTCMVSSSSKPLISLSSFLVSGLRTTPGGGVGQRPLMTIRPPLMPAPGSGPTSPCTTISPPSMPPPIRGPAAPRMNRFPPVISAPASLPHPSITVMFPAAIR